VAIWGAHEQGNETVQSTGLTVQESVKLTASTDANLNSRNFAISGILQLGGQNLYNFQQTLALALGSQGGITVVGTSGNSAPGNTTVSNASGAAGAVQVQSGSTLTAGTGIVSAAVNAGGTLTNFAAFAPTTVYVAGTAPSSYSVLYNPSNSTVNGVVNANQYRAAADYYFLRNDDNAAQVRLGSLRRYHEFNYTSNSTSGNITIDKNNSQVQTIVPTGAITVDGFSNFVTSASDGTNTDQQTDTVTLIIAQGATGYAVNLPASSSTVKYAGGVTTVGTGANTVTMISVTAVNIGGSATYLLTVSPEFQ
jgi:hypothetical protein